MKDKRFKREKIGTYIVISNIENTKHIAVFKDKYQKVRFAKIKTNIKDEFVRQKHIIKSQRNRFDRYMEHLSLSEYQISDRAFYKMEKLEDEFFRKELMNEIIKEIWKLPEPQNRRVYMSLIDGFSYAKIGRIENCTRQAVHQNVQSGIKKLRKNLKKFLS